MHPDLPVRASSHGHSSRYRSAPSLVRGVLAAGVSAALAFTLVQVPPAGAQPEDRSGDPVSQLLGDITDAQVRLEAARNDIADRQQAVNKTLVDLQVAQIELDGALVEADEAAREVETANAEHAASEERLESYSQRLYRQGTSLGAASDFLDPGESGASAERREYLLRASADQRAVVDDHTRARDEAEARQDAADESVRQATARHDEAVALRDEALADIERVSAEVSEREAEVSELEGLLAGAESALGERAPGPAGPEAMDPATGPVEYNATPEEEARAQSIAGAVPEHGDLGAVDNYVLGPDGSSDVGGLFDVGSVMDTANAVRDGDAGAIVDQIMGAVMSANTGSIGPGTGGGNGPSGPPGTGAAAIEAVIARGMSQIGVPYSWGGGDANGPTRGVDHGAGTVGFDCSGLMVYAFAGQGIALPKYSGYQYTAGRQVPVDERRRGDMLFWGPGGSRHVALYLGNGEMLEAQQTGVPVKVSPVRTTGDLQPFAVRMIE